MSFWEETSISKLAFMSVVGRSKDRIANGAADAEKQNHFEIRLRAEVVK
jgi:hypothetical protein